MDTGYRGVFKTLPNIYDVAFRENSLKHKLQEQVAKISENIQFSRKMLMTGQC